MDQVSIQVFAFAIIGIVVCGLVLPVKWKTPQALLWLVGNPAPLFAILAFTCAIATVSPPVGILLAIAIATMRMDIKLAMKRRNASQ